MTLRPPWPTEPLRQPPRRGWMLTVLALHGLLWLAWHLALRPALQPMADGHPPLVWVVVPPPPPAPTALPRPVRPVPPVQPATAHPAAALSPAPVTADTPAPSPPTAVPGAVDLPPPPPVATEEHRPPVASTLRLLDSQASRQAIREAVRQPLLAERTASATGLAVQSQAQRMADAASAAGKGDCSKGQYVGGGMGVLSLPFWLGAAVSGQCGR